MPGPALAAPLFGGLTVGGGLGIASGALGAFGSIFSGIQQSQASDFNARVDRQQAKQSIAESQADAEQTRTDNERKLGSAEAAFGASGVDLSGSPLDVLSDLATQGELSRRLILYKGKTEANKYLAQSAIDSSKSGSAMGAGILGAGTTFLTSALQLGQDTAKPTLPLKALTVPLVPAGVGHPNY